MAPDQEPDWITRALAEAAEHERAPLALRQRIDALATSPRRDRRGSWPGRSLPRLVLLPAVGALTALAVTLILVLGAGGPAGPSVAQAASLGVHGGGRVVSAGRAGWWSYTPGGPPVGSLDLRGVRFPTGLSRPGGWRPLRSAVVALQGRRLLEVRYRRGSARLTYLIAAAPRLRGQHSGYTSFSLSGHPVVSWVEAGHSCLLVGSPGSSATGLLALAES